MLEASPDDQGSVLAALDDGGRRETLRAPRARPSRRNPAAAKITASTTPSRARSMRVSTLPRIGTTCSVMRHRPPIPGSAFRAAGHPCRSACRRQDHRVDGRRARLGCPLAAEWRLSQDPRAGAVGRSLSECTATSISPRRRASRTALTNTPVPPISVRWR